MNLDTFKEIYKDKPLEEKIILFYDNIRNMDRNERDSYDAMINKSKENEEYYRKEAEAMKERVDWLYDDILKEIKELKKIKKKADLIDQINKTSNEEPKKAIETLSIKEIKKINEYFGNIYNTPVPDWIGKIEFEGSLSGIELGYFILVFNKFSNNMSIVNDKISLKLKYDIYNIFGKSASMLFETHYKSPLAKDELYFVKIKYDIDEAKKSSLVNFNNICGSIKNNYQFANLDCFEDNNPED